MLRVLAAGCTRPLGSYSAWSIIGRSIKWGMPGDKQSEEKKRMHDCSIFCSTPFTSPTRNTPLPAMRIAEVKNSREQRIAAHSHIKVHSFRIGSSKELD